MTKKILLLGGGGHCKSVLDTLLKDNEYSEIAIIDKEENIGKHILNIPIIGSDLDLQSLYKDNFRYAFVTIGSIGDATIRMNKLNMLEEIGFHIPNIIDKTSVVSDFVQMESGIFIGKNTVVNAVSTINKAAIINTGAIVEHDCVVGEFTHVAPGSVLCGNVIIGGNTHIGANSVIKQNITIGSNSLIGTGSNVISDIKDNKIAYGNPCKEVQ